MTRNVIIDCSLLFLPPVIFVNSKVPLNRLVHTRWRALFHFIPVIIQLLFMSCSSQQIVDSADDCLTPKGDMVYFPYAIGERCTVMWDQSTPTDVEYEVRLLYYVMGPNCELLQKGQGAPTTVHGNEFSFDVERGITLFSIRTVNTVSAEPIKSRWAYSNNWRDAVDQKPWAIISRPQQ
jgi:hypothetical protein